MALTDYRLLLARLVRAPDDTVTAEDVDRAIAAAVLRLTLDRPRTLVRDVTWAATGHVGPLPAGLTAVSTVLQAEYPAGQVPPELVQVGVQSTITDGQELLCEDVLPAGAVVRVTFTAAHELDDDTDTIPPECRQAVGSWAAHLLCNELATLYSGERDSSINADGSSTDSRARNYAARAREFRGAYYAALGMADPQGSAGSGGSTAAAPTVEGAGAVAAWPARARPWFRVTGG